MSGTTLGIVTRPAPQRRCGDLDNGWLLDGRPLHDEGKTCSARSLTGLRRPSPHSFLGEAGGDAPRPKDLGQQVLRPVDDLKPDQTVRVTVTGTVTPSRSKNCGSAARRGRLQRTLREEESPPIRVSPLRVRTWPPECRASPCSSKTHFLNDQGIVSNKTSGTNSAPGVELENRPVDDLSDRPRREDPRCGRHSRRPVRRRLVRRGQEQPAR